MNCRNVYTIARKSIRRFIRHYPAAHPAVWVVSIVCAGAPMAIVLVPPTNAAPFHEAHGTHGGDDRPQPIPAPGALVLLPAAIALVFARRSKSS